MFCNHCGRRLPEDSVYCSFCGKKLPIMREATTSPELEETTPSESMLLHTLEGHSDRVTSVAFSPDDTMLASGSRDATLQLWDVQTGECLQALEGHNYQLRSVAFSPDNTMLASTSDNTIIIWDAQTGERLRTLRGSSRSVDSVRFSLDSKMLIEFIPIKPSVVTV
jgi:WD40 repeat protein